MSEFADFVSMMHDDLGEHYQRIMMTYKGNITADAAFHAAAILAAAQSNATYTSQLQSELESLRKTLIAIEKSRRDSQG
ncbi:hypothetical protein NIES970_24380 [[Synechococcus] sp. NIES-970]|uniref:hypothetical protein n=1 Tax=Picosynechococcus sp. NKBG15041c TaxID=1407650 RepID=UPI00040635E0|nr:hypothetical protein [Picosynechococcus sp. NKBG15041c]BAW97486.1 hypothetical protein NIES970_24380 [[Synechococcus] sp. NIES-970]